MRHFARPEYYLQCSKEDPPGMKRAVACVLKLAFLVLCVTLFTYQMSFIVTQFANEETTSAVESVREKNLRCILILATEAQYEYSNYSKMRWIQMCIRL